MLEYVQLYPETLAAVKRYPAADRALLYEAMVSYGTEGAEPDWPEDDLKWLIWESLRQRVDLAARKSETNRNNRKRNETNQNETERTGTNQNETERTGTNCNPQSESEPDTETEADPEENPVNPVERTHTQGEQPEGNAGARAGAGQGSLGGDRVNGETVPAGWYDPEHPDRPCDASWLASDAARRAIAQRILDHVVRAKSISLEICSADSGRTIGREIGPALCAAMAAGIPPGSCQQMATAARTLWAWEIRLKAAALDAGTAPPGMEAAWREDVAEMRGDTEDLALYG